METQALFDNLKNGVNVPLFMGHSLISPAVKDLDDLEKKFNEQISKSAISRFGLLTTDNSLDEPGGNSPEYITPAFRILSKTIVSWYGMPLDFGANDILAQKRNLFVGVPVVTDHYKSARAIVGVVQSVGWQEGYDLDGLEIPSGINGILKIDAVTHPDIARKILMDPPALHSVSASVRVKAIPSHDFQDPDEFYNKLGTFDQDGEMYRFIVQDIVRVLEVSLVLQGADSFARLLQEDQTIKKIQEIVPSFGLTPVSGIDYRYLEEPVEFSHFNKPPKTQTRMEFTDFLTQLELSDINSIDKLKAHLADLQAKADRLKALEEIDANLTPDSLRELMSKPTELSEDQKAILELFDTEFTSIDEAKQVIPAFKAHLAELRQETINTYKLLYKGADPALEAAIQKADPVTLAAFNKQYTEELDEKIPLTCQSCGSTDLSRKTFSGKDPVKLASRKERFQKKYTTSLFKRDSK